VVGRELVVVWVGRPQRGDPWEALVGDYRERVGRFVPVRDVALRPAAGDGRARLAAEAVAVRAALPSPVRLVALDRRGAARTSRRLAEELGGWLDEWPHPIAFLVGSDLGLDEGLLGESFTRLSLGPLTLPHLLARLVLYEQLFRALSLRAGMKYHRDPP
jgi:23S rRNA (pseudouridine1915-N3)-methyltransferase